MTIEQINASKDVRWTILAEVPPAQRHIYGQREVVARCVCGKLRRVSLQSITQGKSKSCGCLTREKAIEILTKHGESRSKLYKAWSQWLSRGNLVAAWKSWPAFRDGMGERPPGGVVARHDLSKPLGPGNAFWGTWADAQKTTKQYTVRGQTHSARGWRKTLRADYSVFSRRMDKGMKLEEVVEMLMDNKIPRRPRANRWTPQEVEATIAEYRPLAWKHAGIWMNRGLRLRTLPTGASIEDFRTWAMLGLWKAAASFNPSKGINFATWAIPIIQQKMYFGLREFMPVGTKSKGKTVFAHSLDERALRGDGETLLERGVGAHNDPAYAASDDAEQVMYILSMVPREQDRIIIRRMVLEGDTAREVGLSLGLKHFTVQFHKDRALKKLAERLAEKEGYEKFSQKSLDSTE